MNTTRVILLLEDDRRIRDEVSEALTRAGFRVKACATLQEARDVALDSIDLALLDLGLPDGDGLTLCSQLRQTGPDLPIMIVTARDSVDQRVRGLELGADDYVVKPFHLDELLARIKSLFRRSDRSGAGSDVMQLGELRIDLTRRTLMRDQEAIEVTRREFDLLAFLCRYPRRPWTREALLEEVWGEDFDGGPRTVDVHVRRLRKAIELNPDTPEVLVTEYGVGYVLKPPTIR